jgi:hypothetical protein
METLTNSTNKGTDEMRSNSSPLKHVLHLLRAQVRLFITAAQAHDLPPIFAYRWMKEEEEREQERL